jgi:hypothetical protein
MKIEMTRIGILENHLPPNNIIECEGPVTLGGYLRFIDNEYGPGLIGHLLDGDQPKPHIAVLLNGRSIRALPEGIHTAMKDGDHIIFSIMMDGG